MNTNYDSYNISYNSLVSANVNLENKIRFEHKETALFLSSNGFIALSPDDLRNCNDRVVLLTNNVFEKIKDKLSAGLDNYQEYQLKSIIKGCDKLIEPYLEILDKEKILIKPLLDEDYFNQKIEQTIQSAETLLSREVKEVENINYLNSYTDFSYLESTLEAVRKLKIDYPELVSDTLIQRLENKTNNSHEEFKRIDELNIFTTIENSNIITLCLKGKPSGSVTPTARSAWRRPTSPWSWSIPIRPAPCSPSRRCGGSRRSASRT